MLQVVEQFSKSCHVAATEDVALMVCSSLCYKNVWSNEKKMYGATKRWVSRVCSLLRVNKSDFSMTFRSKIPIFKGTMHH